MWDRTFIGQGATGNFLTKTLRDSSGPVDVATGVSSVTFSMKEVNSATPAVNNQACVIIQDNAVPPNNKGVVQYQWGATELNVPGIYVGQFKVTYASGKSALFPDTFAGQMIIYVTPKVGS